MAIARVIGDSSGYGEDDADDDRGESQGRCDAFRKVPPTGDHCGQKGRLR